MSNIIQFLAGEGIEITANDTNKTLSIKNKCFLTDAQLEIIRSGLSGSDKFLTESQIRALIAQLSGGNVGDNTPPEGFPKFFKSSTNYTIPKSGRYKILIVGGGGSGAWWAGNGDIGASGSDSYVEYNSLKHNGVGGSTGISGSSSNDGSGGIPSIPFNMHAGIGGTKGGDPKKNGESGYGAGGSGGIKDYSGGGGGGSPLNYMISSIQGENALDDRNGKGGKGYGAGGGGGTHGGGGSSGCLNTIISFINKNTVLKIIIGAGGITNKATPNAGGDGAQGAVLIEWLGNS